MDLHPFSFQNDNLNMYIDPFKEIFNTLSNAERSKLMQLNKKTNDFFLSIDFKQTQHLKTALELTSDFCQKNDLKSIKPNSVCQPDALTLAPKYQAPRYQVHRQQLELKNYKFLFPYTVKNTDNKTYSVHQTLTKVADTLNIGRSLVNNADLRFQAMQQIEHASFGLNIHDRHQLYKALNQTGIQLVKDFFPSQPADIQALKNLATHIEKAFRIKFSAIRPDISEKLTAAAQDENLYHQIIDELVKLFINPDGTSQPTHLNMHAFDDYLFMQRANVITELGEPLKLFRNEVWSATTGKPCADTIYQKMLALESTDYLEHHTQWCLKEFKAQFHGLERNSYASAHMSEFSAFVDKHFIFLLCVKPQDHLQNLKIFNSITALLDNLAHKINIEPQRASFTSEMQQVKHKAYTLMSMQMPVEACLSLLKQAETVESYINAIILDVILRKGSDAQLQSALELIKQDPKTLYELFNQSSATYAEKIQRCLSAELLALSCNVAHFDENHIKKYVAIIRAYCANGNPEYGYQFLCALQAQADKCPYTDRISQIIMTPIAIGYAKQGNFAKAQEICAKCNPAEQKIILYSIENLRKKA